MTKSEADILHRFLIDRAPRAELTTIKDKKGHFVEIAKFKFVDLREAEALFKTSLCAKLLNDLTNR